MSSKITALPAATSILGTDLLPIVYDPSGTPTNKKISFADMMNGYALSSDLADYVQIADLPTVVPANETDPIFTASQAFNIDSGDITNLGNLSGVNTGDQDLSSYALTANVHNVPAGGDAGCVLTKNSNSDYDLVWAAAGSGSQTPWLANEDAAGYDLSCLNVLGLGASSTTQLSSISDSNFKYGLEIFDNCNDVAAYIFPAYRADGSAAVTGDFLTTVDGVSWYAAAVAPGAYTGINSVTINEFDQISLVNDNNDVFSMYYGADSMGNKGWYSTPVSFPEAPTDGTKYARCDGAWVAVGGGGSPVGGCKAIQYADPMSGASFCGCGDFVYDYGVMRIGAPGTMMTGWTTLDYCLDGRQLSFYGSDDCLKGSFGWADGEAPYLVWQNCCENISIRMDATCLRLIGGDTANIYIEDTNNSIGMSFGCGFDISGSGVAWGISWCWAHPNNVMINHAYYLPQCGPTADGQVIKYDSMSGEAVWGTAGGGGSGSASGCTYSIQYSDGMGGFCDGGQNNGVNYFEYSCDKSLRLLGCDFGGFDQQLRIYDAYSDRYAWTFNSTDTCGGSCGAGFDFLVGQLYTSSFRVGDSGGCGSLDFRPHDWRSVFTNAYCQTAMWGTINCGAFFGYSDCGDYMTFTEGGCVGIAGHLSVYNDFFRFKDYELGHSGYYCDLIFTLNNGCNYGFTQLNFTGLGLGGVVNSDAGPLILATCECAFLDSNAGYTQLYNTWDFQGNICGNGSSTLDGWVTITAPGSTTCGCIQFYQGLAICYTTQD